MRLMLKWIVLILVNLHAFCVWLPDWEKIKTIFQLYCWNYITMCCYQGRVFNNRMYKELRRLYWHIPCVLHPRLFPPTCSSSSVSVFFTIICRSLAYYSQTIKCHIMQEIFLSFTVLTVVSMRLMFLRRQLFALCKDKHSSACPHFSVA